MNKVWLFRIWFSLGLLALILSISDRATAMQKKWATQEGAPLILVLTADGPLTPTMAEYLGRGLRLAEQQQAEAVILELNTPGGSIDLMNRMVKEIRNSPIPVIVYISPRGAMAASAGTVLTLAGHASAMAPNTTIGAASPVDMSGQDLQETIQAKEKNLLKATVRSLAERRGEKAIALAEETIENAVAVSDQEALAAHLVDFIATDTTALLRQLNGFRVETSLGEKELDTAFAMVEPIPPTIIERLLGALTNPNILVLLMNLGVAAILIEISSPGGWVAGFIGVVCLALSIYGLGIVPVNWFGIIFLVIAFALFILDIKAPTHGALTAAGVGSLIVGALVLFNTPVDAPGFQPVSIPLVVASSLITGAMFLTILIFALRAQKAPVRMGMQSLVGRTGNVTAELNPRGQVQLGGELWSAELIQGPLPVPKGTRVQVIGVEGLKLLVQRVVEENTDVTTQNLPG